MNVKRFLNVLILLLGLLLPITGVAARHGKKAQGPKINKQLRAEQIKAEEAKKAKDAAAQNAVQQTGVTPTAQKPAVQPPPTAQKPAVQPPPTAQKPAVQPVPKGPTYPVKPWHRTNLERHWEKHCAEFPEFHSQEEYGKWALAFFNHPPQGTLIKLKEDSRMFYHQKTNTFGVTTLDGVPKTMFRPSRGIDYWRRQ